MKFLIFYMSLLMLLDILVIVLVKLVKTCYKKLFKIY